MTTNRQRQRRQRNSMIFHVILFILVLSAIVAAIVIGFRWLRAPGKSGILPTETMAEQSRTETLQEISPPTEPEVPVSVGDAVSPDSVPPT